MRALRSNIVALCVLLSACAATPLPTGESVNARPVTVVKSETIDIDAKLAEGKLAYRTREYAASYDAFTQALLHDRRHTIAWLGRANAALALGREDDALEAFNNVDTSDLSETEKQELLAGLSLLTMGQTKTADQEKRLLKALTFAGDDIRLWNTLGQYYDQTGQWDKSIDVYVEALKIGEGRDSIINNLGTSLMYQGRYKEALDKFKQARVIDPTSELYDNNERLIAALSGEYNSAVKGLTPKRAAWLLNDAGVIALKRGDIEIAKSLLTRATAVSPVYHVKAHANLQKIALVN